MDAFASALQQSGYYFSLLYPHIPTEALTITFAVIPIYTGAHAALKRPSSAAKPPKKASILDEADDDETDFTFEPDAQTFSLGEAILFPVFAGLALCGLYYLVTHFDPALISKILNWQFTLAGVAALATFSSDAMNVGLGFLFPDAYYSKGAVWYVQTHSRAYKSSDGRQTTSALPKIFVPMAVPAFVEDLLWSTRDFYGRKLVVKAYVRTLLHVSSRISPQLIIGTVFAIAIQLYIVSVETPWYLNNLAGTAFAYYMLQTMSPATPKVGTLLLIALFFYDIYFVFYTPIMVGVATKLDIPAKILIPRPGGMGMLGLGDICLPGMLISFALKFDLWLHYYYQQRPSTEHEQSEWLTDDDEGSPAKSPRIIKPKYQTATGHWGTRFWTGSRLAEQPPAILGTQFAKAYFNATLTGYVFGMILTLIAMLLSGHAQPALLYLAPTVISALWLTAWRRGETHLLWNYTSEEPEDDKKKQEGADKESKEDKKPEKKKVDDAEKELDLFHISLKLSEVSSKPGFLPNAPAARAPRSQSRSRSTKSKTLPKGWVITDEPATPARSKPVSAASAAKRAERARRRETLRADGE